MNAQLSQDIDKALADLEAIELTPAPYPTPSPRFPWEIALGGLGIGLLVGMTIAGALF